MSTKYTEKAKKLYYESGKAYENRGKIFELLFKALKEHDREAALILSNAYQDMEIVEDDFEKSYAYRKLADDFEDPEGLLAWADDIQRDAIYSLSLKKKAADKKYPKAMFEYGRSVFFQDAWSGFNYMKAAADKGYPKAMYYVGLAYWYGYRFLTNYKNAFKYLKLAAKAEYFDAFYYLGYMYDFGIGTKVNHKKAREYYEQVQNIHHYEAQGLIGRQMVFGLGCKKDVSKGLELLNKSYNMVCDEPEIFLTLAKIYHEGIGVEVDHKKADELLKQARERHDYSRGHRIN